MAKVKLFTWQGKDFTVNVVQEEWEKLTNKEKYDVGAELLRRQDKTGFFSKIPVNVKERQEWIKKHPDGLAFIKDMQQYGYGQGFTWGYGEDIGLQGDNTPYKYFSHLYPGMSAFNEVVGSMTSGGGVAGGAND